MFEKMFQNAIIRIRIRINHRPVELGPKTLFQVGKRLVASMRDKGSFLVGARALSSCAGSGFKASRHEKTNNSPWEHVLVLAV